MTLDMWTTLAILAAAIVLFVTERLRVDLVALAVVVALILTGVLDTQEALSGFANPAVLTIAALFVVGGGILHTGLAGAVGRRALGVSGPSEPRLMLTIVVTVALLSAVLSDTGAVAVLMPVTISMAAGAGVSPSRLLMPLAFGALLGGATTLIGTPPNIIVSDLLRSAGEVPFGFFSFTPVGLTLLAVGVAYLIVVGRRLLPAGTKRQEPQRVASPEELVDLYRLPDSMFRLRVRRGSELVGKTLGESRLRSDFDVTVLAILRPLEPVGSLLGIGSRADMSEMAPTAESILELDDVLIVDGDSDDVWHAAAAWNFGVQPAEPDDEDALIGEEAGIAEVVLPPRSTLVGHTLVELDFGRAHGLTVLGLTRPGTKAEVALDTADLRFGDVLLVQGPWRNILALKEHRRDFVVMGQPEAMVGAPSRKKAPIAALVLVVMVALIASGATSVAAASLLGALMMVLSGCLSMDRAYDMIDWRSVVLIAGTISMSVALQKVELVDLVADAITGSLGSAGPLVVLAGLFLLTSLLTQVLSNTATTVLIAPIALATANQVGVTPHAFLMAVAVAASMAMASPVSSPVNTLVMGVGDYKFGDYVKVGLPLIGLALIVSMVLLPRLFPF